MKTVVSVNGMNCGHCAAAVEKALRAVPGVKDVGVSLERKRADVEHDGADVDAMKKAVTDAGFTVAGAE